MTGSRPLLVSAVVVLALLAGASGAVTGKPVLSATISNGPLTPGEDTALQVTVLNAGTTSASTTQATNTARAVRVTVEDGDAPIDVRSGPQAVGLLPEGATPPLQIPVSVHEDAEAGTYDVPITVKYTHTEIDRFGIDEENVTRRLYAEIEIDAGASFTVESVESGARVGATGTVNLSLRNTGSATADDASVSVTSQAADLTLGAAGSGSRFVGDWGPGEVRTVPFEVTTAPTGASQPYGLRATVSYDDDNGIPRTATPLSFGVRPAPRQAVSVTATESNVSVAGSGTVAVTLRNDGPLAMRDASVQLSSTSGHLVFGQSASASRFVGAWEPGEERTVAYDLTATGDAERRPYTLQATVSYEDREGDAGQTAPVSLGVTPDPEQAFSVGGVESTLSVGAEGTLNATITNDGDALARNLVVTFASTGPTVTPLETEYPVGDLAPGDDAPFSFPIEISEAAEAGPKQFTLQARYRTAEGELRRSDTLDLRTSVARDVPVFSLSVDGSTVEAGSSTRLNVTITNDDDEPVSDISAKLFANDPVSTTNSEAFVADLAPGESTTVTFGVGAGGGAMAKTYPLEIDFQYDDADGDTITSQTYRLPITVTEPEGGGGLPLWLIGLGALAVLVVVWVAYRRLA